MTYLTAEQHALLAAMAEAQGQTVSGLLGNIVRLVLDGEDHPETHRPLPTRARREGKVTVRLVEDVRERLAAEAQAQGVPPSTWAAALLSARIRKAPQMVAGERRGVRAAYRQLRGLAVNANQIAHALNRGVLTGAGAELTKAEVERLRADISDLRKALSTYAEGRFKVQAGLGDDDQP
ncbi:plasmid mobilization relaxosome protein MobC [Pseudooceanicola sp. CBS1P-1]|uniref:Plasmid mobilization relaxosome protein MobC n=2 Tax=Paracoccaceae TaxID=31989 RepID=A0A6L7G4L2_9RHOB|nr:plasmid mobilization relaxosome protein MobC [Pseudooceanicola endophyticus]MXN18941.1 plasmid mobilization relaxosome protein MobC [Pseudooceanicola albus]